MKESSTKENVVQPRKILFQFTHLTSCLKYMKKMNGGLINGIEEIIEWILILISHFLNNFRNLEIMYHE